MQPRTSLRIVRPSDKMDEGRVTRDLTADQKREVFKGLVVGSLDAGFLRYTRRQQLLEIAARMGIEEFEACLLIAEAQFRSTEIDPMEPSEVEDYGDHRAVSRGLSVSMQITLALVAAAFLDLIIVLWLF